CVTHGVSVARVGCQVNRVAVLGAGLGVWLGGPGHAVNTSLYARLGHPWPRTVPARPTTHPARKRAAGFWFSLNLARCCWPGVLCRCAGPGATWMSHASLQGCIHGVSRTHAQHLGPTPNSEANELPAALRQPRSNLPPTLRRRLGPTDNSHMPAIHFKQGLVSAADLLQQRRRAIAIDDNVLAPHH